MTTLCALRDLADSKAMIIDVRFNGGDQDVVSFEILRRFSPERIQVAKHKFRYGHKYTKEVPIYLKGPSNTYTKPVYLLTSPQSGSAAETFNLSSLSISYFKRIGFATEGALSTTLDKKLPNGWDFYLSSEIYMDNNGQFYENVGVQVDYELNYPRERNAFFGSVVNDIASDKRNILREIESDN